MRIIHTLKKVDALQSFCLSLDFEMKQLFCVKSKRLSAQKWIPHIFDVAAKSIIDVEAMKIGESLEVKRKECIASKFHQGEESFNTMESCSFPALFPWWQVKSVK